MLSAASVDVAELEATVQAQIIAAEEALNAAAAGRPLCRVGDGASPVGEIKRREGALAALLDLRRAVASSDEATVGEAIAAVTRRWSASTRLSERSAAWRAYYDGARDALATVRPDAVAVHPSTAGSRSPATAGEA